MKEHEKARAWRERHGLSLDQLATLSGYTRQALYWMERGLTPPDRSNPKRAIASWVWKRYKNICAGVDSQIRAGKVFDWG